MQWGGRQARRGRAHPPEMARGGSLGSTDISEELSEQDVASEDQVRSGAAGGRSDEVPLALRWWLVLWFDWDLWDVRCYMWQCER